MESKHDQEEIKDVAIKKRNTKSIFVVRCFKLDKTVLLYKKFTFKSIKSGFSSARNTHMNKNGSIYINFSLVDALKRWCGRGPSILYSLIYLLVILLTFL